MLFNLYTLSYAFSKDGETRTAVVNYDVTPMDVINIQAKYTDLTVDTWDKNQVMIEATLRFDGKVTDKMQKFLDMFEEEVKENISYEGGELLVKTNIDEPNKFQLGSKHVGITISFNEDELKVEYAIKVPAKNELVVKNSYRDLYLNGSFEDVTIDQYSGDLKAQIIKKGNIKLKYGSAQFDEINAAKMELYEQEIKANRIEKLDINTKYSELKIDYLGDTEISSYESDFEIENLTSMEGNLKYGLMEITDRMASGELTTYEFDIEAKEIGDLRFINSKYGNYEAQRIENLIMDQSYEDDFDIDELGSLKVTEEKYDNFRIGQLTAMLVVNGYEGDVSIDQLGKNVSAIDISGKYIETRLGVEGVDYQLVMNTKYGKNNIDRSSSSVKRYIKDGDNLEVEVISNPNESNLVSISIAGYEMDLELID